MLKSKKPLEVSVSPKDEKDHENGLSMLKKVIQRAKTDKPVASDDKITPEDKEDDGHRIALDTARSIPDDTGR